MKRCLVLPGNIIYHNKNYESGEEIELEDKEAIRLQKEECIKILDADQEIPVTEEKKAKGKKKNEN